MRNVVPNSAMGGDLKTENQKVVMEFKCMEEKSWKIVYTLVFSSIFVSFFVLMNEINFITVLPLLLSILVFYVVSNGIVVHVKKKVDLDKRDLVLVCILALILILNSVISYAISLMVFFALN